MKKELLQAIIRANKCDYRKSFGNKGVDKYIEDQDLVSANIGEVARFLLNPELCKKYKIKGFKTEEKESRSKR